MSQRIDPDDFLSLKQLSVWQRDLDDRGLRATASPEHHAYIEDLTRRLHEVGVADVVTEPVPVRKWTARRWGLDLTSTQGANSAIPVISYVAYSGDTGPGGCTGKLSAEPVSGCIGLVDIAQVSMTASDFDGLDYDAPELPTHAAGWDGTTPYERIWLSQDLMRAALDRFQSAGAAGLVLVVDLPHEDLEGAYLLYDGVHRDIPALFVGRQAGARLREAMAEDASVTLTLDAVTAQDETYNIVGLIPGSTDELVVLQSHTDGPNGLEDNGPEAIVAMAEYLARQPRTDLPRGVLVVLTTGHFAIEEAWGVEAFLSRHREDLVPRIAAVLSLEHLGALSRPQDYPDGSPRTTYEFGCCFATPHRLVVDVVREAMDSAQVTDSIVLRPFVPDTTGNSPDGTTWPGDGGPFWHTAGLPTANFITGPNYLFNVESVFDLIDVDAMRRQAIAYTEATLALAAASWETLRQPVTGSEQ